MPCVLRILSCVNGEPTSFDGKYVKAYDPTVHPAIGQYNGGILEVTDDIKEAMQFPSFIEAMEKWREPAGCDCHGIRPWDGRPNRPLTAWHVEVFPCS